MRWVGTVIALVAASLALPAAPAVAVPACPEQPTARTLVTGLGMLESVIAGPDERLYFTEAEAGQLMVLEQPGAQPEALVSGVESPGGLAFEPEGTLLLGHGTSVSNGVVGNVAPAAGVLRVNTRSGEAKPYAAGLGQSNGLALGHDGALYASNDFAVAGIDRVVDGRVENGWAAVNSANGLVVDSAGRYLYAAQTFQPAAIARVEIANPSNVTTFLAAAPDDWAAGLDGLTRDSDDRLYVAANGGGEIWRVDRRGEACSLAAYPPFPDGPSAVAFGNSGRNGPFPRTSLYFVTFGGELVELPGVLRARGRGATGRRPPARVIRGGPGDDRLVGTHRADRILGRGGDDVLIGRGGDDVLIGGPGENRLFGGRGNDIIRARNGEPDLIRCGPGYDIAIVDEVEKGIFGCEEIRRPASAGP